MKKLIFITICLLFKLLAIAQINTDRILTIGTNALQFNDYVLSIQYFNQVINVKPYLPEPYMLRASAKIQLGDFQGADQDCTEAIDRNPFLHYAYYLRGFARKKMSYYKEAYTDFTKALEYNPNDSIYLINRIESSEKSKDYSAAIKDIDLLLKLNPKKYDWLYYKGNFQLELKDTTEAEKTINKLIELNKDSYLGWSARGLIKMVRKDLDGALSDYNEAISHNSKYAGDFINRGNINNDKKFFKQALSDFDNAVKLDSTEYLSYFNRGLIREYLGDKNNALNDFIKVLKLDPTKTEALLQKADIEKSLGDFKKAKNDYKLILVTYPYFIPVYEQIASIEDKLGNIKSAYLYRQKAKNIDLNKEYYNHKAKESLSAKNQIVKNTQKQASGDKNKLFYQIAMQNNVDSINDNQNTTSYKGNVQDKFTNLTNESDFLLSFITFKYQLRRTNLFHPAISNYNKQKIIPSPLGISNIELPLTSELANFYFTAIKKTSDSLANNKTNADIYFTRALEFTSVKDYIGALEDLNKAIEIRPGFVLAIFARANIESKLLYTKTDNILPHEITENYLLNSKFKNIDNNKFNFTIDNVLSDYEKVIELNPDFSFAYYNKGNISCTQKDFNAAISNYSKSIEIDPDFAEAYFNRGLTYLFINEDGKGLADLSKAGELGIYKAYNLLQRFKK